MTGERPASPRQLVSDESLREVGACEGCKFVHEPPACPPRSLLVRRYVYLPPHVDRMMRERVPYRERSPWIAGLIRRELGA